MSPIDKELMGKNYEEMGLINLSICNDSHIAENNDYNKYQKILKGRDLQWKNSEHKLGL